MFVWLTSQETRLPKLPLSLGNSKIVFFSVSEDMGTTTGLALYSGFYGDSMVLDRFLVLSGFYRDSFMVLYHFFFQDLMGFFDDFGHDGVI